MDSGLQYIATGLMVGGIYGLIALSIVLVFKATGIFNFAVGNIMVMGAFICWTFAQQLGLNIWLAIVVSILLGSVIGWAINRFTMRPLIGQPALASIMVTLALMYFFDGIVLLFWGGSLRTFPNFMPGDRIHIGPAIFPTDLFGAFIIGLAVFGILALFFWRTRIGLAMRATAESHEVARARGISVEGIFGITWAISAAIATLSGIFLAARMGLEMNISAAGLKAFPAVIFGGLESVPGAIVGGLTVGLLENLAGGFISTWVMDITPYIILLLVLIIRPSGLFGLKRIERI